MKRVNVAAIKDFLEQCGCRFTSISEPINSQSVVTLVCTCGTSFTQSLKQIAGYKTRKSSISCGCTDKRWTNDSIDAALSGRGITRETNCNIRGFQPSVTKITWKCDTCGDEWNSRVDSVINKKSGCPSCAGNKAYTVDSLNKKLHNQGRDDLEVLELYAGSLKDFIKKSRYGLFLCTKCGDRWKADIHNILKFGYGCPLCNDNIGSRLVVDGETFHSKLEFYFWKRYHELNKQYRIMRQERYSPNRRLTCDFYIPQLQLWVEVTGQYLLKNTKYASTIAEKRSIIENKGHTFVTLSTFTEINKFLDQLQ